MSYEAVSTVVALYASPQRMNRADMLALHARRGVRFGIRQHSCISVLSAMRDLHTGTVGLAMSIACSIARLPTFARLTWPEDQVQGISDRSRDAMLICCWKLLEAGFAITSCFIS